jgi:endoglucanase
MKVRSAILAAAASGLLAAASVLVLAPLANAAAGCRVDYSVPNTWPGGFTAYLTITNLGDPITNGWTLGFAFPAAGQAVASGWSATWSQSGANVTAVNLDWNKSLATNASTQIGFNGTWTTSNPNPSTFTLNGITCTGGVTTSPSASRTGGPSASASPSRSATASPSASRSPSASPSGSPNPTGAAPPLHVSGNKLLTNTGATYRLLGVNRSGGEFACIQGNGMWDGPMDQASITTIRTWKVRAVRVPLNEECWLGTSNVPATGASGAAYQQNVRNYVNLLIAGGITPIIEMHWSFGAYGGAGANCSEAVARCQKPMPDAQNAPAFWTSVANAYKGNDAVVFDLFNEPFPDIPANSVDAGWRCFRDGGTCPGIGFPVAGFQSLVNAVRGTGATNVIMVGGLTWSNNIAQWLQWKPSDPLNNLMAFAHVYNFNACINTSCWDSQWAPVAAQVPLTISEIGENDCAHGFVDQVMAWADAHGAGYLGWTWNTWPCTSGPALIIDYNGTATAFGQGIKDHLAVVSN